MFFGLTVVQALTVNTDVGGHIWPTTCSPGSFISATLRFHAFHYCQVALSLILDYLTLVFTSGPLHLLTPSLNGWLLSSFRPWLHCHLLGRPFLTPWRMLTPPPPYFSHPSHLILFFFTSFPLSQTFLSTDLFGWLLPGSEGFRARETDVVPAFMKLTF